MKGNLAIIFNRLYNYQFQPDQINFISLILIPLKIRQVSFSRPRQTHNNSCKEVQKRPVLNIFEKNFFSRQGRFAMKIR